MKLLLKYRYLWAALLFGTSFAYYAHDLGYPPVAVWDEVLQVPAGRSLWTFDRAKYTHTENPPLGKALIGLSIKMFGDERWVHRLPSALSAAAIAALLFLLMLEMTGDGVAGLLASGLWLTSSMGYLHARLGTLDMMTCFFFTAGFFAFIRSRFAKSNRTRVLWLLAACAFAAFGGMVKAIVVLLFPIFLIGLVLGRKNWKLSSSLPWWLAGSVVFSLIAFFGSYAFFGYSPSEAIEELKFIYYFHHHDVSTHPSLSSWWQWLLLRGNFYYLKTPLAGNVWVQVLCALNPVLWGLGEISAVVLLLLSLRGRDDIARLIVLGIILQLIFWAALKHRTLLYYALPIEPFFCLAIALLFSKIVPKEKFGVSLIWGALITLTSAMAFVKYHPFQ